MTAFINHRVRSWRQLRRKATQFGILGLSLAESLVSQPALVGRDPWRHSLPRTTAFQYLPRPNPAIEPLAFAAAIEAAGDDPEETVRLLSDAFERQFGTHWPKAAGRAYINSLQSGLARRLVTAVQETQERWKQDPAVPTWTEGLEADERLDFAQVASAIRDSGEHADWLLAERFDAVGRPLTPAWVTGWLYLAKGIRNRAVHADAWPAELRCVAVFMARLLLHAFVCAFPKIERNADAESSVVSASPQVADEQTTDRT